jgi:2,4-dienoyl-CoA reductase-like NADH-dependent reductase (Old Yellow Enzyme family)
MYTLTHKDPQFAGELFGVTFVDGAAQTNNADAVAYFRRRADRGFGVLATGDEPVAAVPEDGPTRAELVATAEALGITVPSGWNKTQITQAIHDHGLDEPA